MAEVRALQDVGQFTASIEELREILAISPDLPEANYRLGVGLMQTGEPSRAVWALQKASESPQYEVVAGLMLASALYSTDNYDEAIRAADRVLEKDPDRVAALRLRAKAQLSARRLEAALEDSTRLVELYPDDYGLRALHATILMDLGKTEEAQRAHDLLKEMGEASEDEDFRNRACLAPALFAKDHLKDLEKAEALYEDCARRLPTDPVVVRHLSQFFDGIGKPERSTELIRAVVEKAPESLAMRSTLSARLQRVGDEAGAEQVLKDAVESFGSAAAWNLLVTFYRGRNEPQKALEAIEKVRELSGGGSDQVRFTHADILVDIGDLERAEEVSKTLKEDTYQNLIKGRVLLASGDPAGALVAFQYGIRNWPNNAGARYLAGLAAYQLGDFERAISELREAVRVDNAATSAALLLARLHLERGEYKKAVTFAHRAMRGRPQSEQASAYIITARALTELGQYDRARSSTDLLAKREGWEREAIAERALVERTAVGPEAAVKVLEEADVDLSDPANEKLLRLLADNLSAAGRTEEAIRRLAKISEKRPEAVAPHEIRGALLAEVGRVDEARSAYRKALDLDGDRPGALGGLATLEANEGDLKTAIDLFDRAADSVADTPVYAYAAAQLELEADLTTEAEKRLRNIVRRFPGEAGARNDLAWLLGERGEDLDVALQLAEEARRLDPSPAILDTLGWVHLKRGESEAAVSVLEEALAAKPESPSIRYHLGSALSQAGHHARAREMLRKALESGDFEEAQAARQELAQLEKL